MSELKEARIKAGYTIEEIATKLNIKRQYLVDLEAGNFSELPGMTYVKGYIKLYRNFLGLADVKLEIQQEIVNENITTTHLTTKLKLFITLLSAIMLLLTIITYKSIKPVSSRLTSYEEIKLEQNYGKYSTS